MTFVFPRWLFPNNLGDSILATVIPRLLFKKYGEPVDVITWGDDYKTFYRQNDLNKTIHINRIFSDEELSKSEYFNFDWRNFCLGRQVLTNHKIARTFTNAVYPEWHPQVFSYWKDHPELVDHPTANLVMVNYLLQLGLTEYLWDGTDLAPDINTSPVYPHNHFNLGIVPATKLAGRPSPHPGCNGLGLRYKREHWEAFISHIESKDPTVEIFSFDNEQPNLGRWMGKAKDLTHLAEMVNYMDLGVCSDGGLHHMFHAVEVPTVLFTGTLVNKAEFFKTAMDFYPEHLHLPCRKQCRSYFTEVFGGEDKSKTCKLECADLDPIGLAEYTLEQIKMIRNLKDANIKS
jgi:hypothetical protein